MISLSLQIAHFVSLGKTGTDTMCAGLGVYTMRFTFCSDTEKQKKKMTKFFLSSPIFYSSLAKKLYARGKKVFAYINTVLTRINNAH